MIEGIISILSLLWVLLAGTSTPEKSTILNKKPAPADCRKNFHATLKCWFNRHFYIICILAFVIGIIFFCWFFFWFAGVSAVESGTVYNQMDKII